MITEDNFFKLLVNLGFTANGDIYTKSVNGIALEVNKTKQQIIYPEYPKGQGITVNERQTCNFSSNENFVVFECVHRLLEKGYKPQHLELEPKWKIGHGASGGRADILVKDNSGNSLLIIECKTAGKEHDNAWKDTLHNGGQLFSYVQQAKSTQYICLYSSNFIDGKVEYKNQIVSLIDNEKLLEENTLKGIKANLQPLSYTNAQKVEDLYKTWVETYSQDYATKGIFEDDIPAYHIGKQKFSLNDLQAINSKDIQGKYHEFATILRQHNVSGRENAFDKLVNLFLCKIVDESRNPNELKFYWKGIAYDSNFDLQDRLQLLYQSGMKEFLGEDVTYIDNAAIDDAFRLFKNDPDATRDTIKRYFRELKFFTNNDFAFIDVHNERLFYQNAAVLLKIVLMLQDIRLKTDEQNQFLGDMFEGFLDQGIKQSEGQFFTPMPIVKFILSSLPLARLLVDNEQPPKVIDYACGAGHFLNEYAMQIGPVVKQHKTLPLADYHAAITGIEKEYRLSKVAKVSAFMYGQDNVQIIYNDALAENLKIKDNSYSLLVANPPYSVKGFLETLSASDRIRFELTESIDEKSYANNNSIEAFFIERAKQLLKADGVAGIIVPSSILSKGTSKISAKKTNVYVAAREILLKYFDLVAIAEFGSGTFGKTGTNTVTLFLRRRKQDPDLAEHYRNRIESWFNGDDSKDTVFADDHFIRSYCNHLAYKLEDYQTLLQGKPNDKLLNTELFAEYRKEFNNLSDTKNRSKQKTFTALSKEEQQAELDKRFLAFVQSIEKDKLYYFVLASLNPSETVIVRSPSGNAEMKKFLGYEWSSAKGNEGIKYLGGQSVTVEKDEEGEEALEQDDKRVLENLLNLNNIQTPLYDPHDLLNSNKINSLIRANFNGEVVVVPESLQGYVTTARLVDMLDFSRKEFSKAINLTPKKNILIESRWEIFSLDKLMTISRGASPRPIDQYITDNESGINWIKIGDVKPGDKYISKTAEKITAEGAKKSKEVNIGDFVLSNSMSYGRPYIINTYGCIHDGWLLLSNIDSKLNKDFLYNVLSTRMVQDQFINLATGTTVDNLNVERVSSVKIPLPTLDIQQQIVNECEAVDKEVTAAQAEIEVAKNKIESIINKVFAPMRKLSEITSKIGSGATPRGGESSYKESGISLIRSQNIYDDGFKEKGLAFIDENQAKLLENVTIEANDVLFNITGASVARCCVVDVNYLPARVNQHVAIIRPTKTVEAKYLHHILISPRIKETLLDIASNSSTREAITKAQLEEFKIPVPPLTDQQRLVAEIEKLEQSIAVAEAIITAAPAKKQAILQTYL